MNAAAAGVFPKWMLLEPYLFRRDDDKSFPDDTVAPIRASGTTSWGAHFRIAFSLANPPSISRLYAQLPGFPGPDEDAPLQIVATHRHLALLDITTSKPSQGVLQNLFSLKVNENNPSSSSLIALPPCTQLRGHDRKLRTSSNATPRLLDSLFLGIWCADKGHEFVVAELTLSVQTHGRIRTKMAADICFLRSSTDKLSSTDNQLGREKWKTKRVFLPTTNDLWKLSHWQTDAVIPFQQWLCWIDYHQGILFCDVSEKVPAPTASFLWFPSDSYSLKSTIKSPRSTPCSGNGRVSVVNDGSVLKFVYVARHDGDLAFAELEPGTGFTITCHTLVLGGSGSSSSMSWKEDYIVTSEDLPVEFRLGLPVFPQVDIDKPQVVHFLFLEFGKAYAKMSLLSIDMNKKEVESFDLYMDGNDCMDENDPLQNEDAEFITEKCLSPTPTPFLPCEFPRFCYLSRKRKDME